MNASPERVAGVTRPVAPLSARGASWFLIRINIPPDGAD
jgi:hypothetical protein